VLQQASEGGGEVDGDQRSRDPLPGVLEAVLVQALACQSPFWFFLIRKILPAQVRRIGGFLFYFCKAFTSFGDISDKVSHSLHTWAEVGGGRHHMTGSGPVYRSTEEFPVKTGLLKLAHHTCSFIFYLDNKLQKSNCREL
jgi:hypothetical protein